MLAVSASLASAQKTKEPRRPPLAATADTNDALAYYDAGLQLVRSKPDKAADAFYWAGRLNPLSAESFYARRIALLLADTRLLMKYTEGDRRTIQSDEVRRIDSLYYHALTLNPFVSQQLSRELFNGYLQEIANDYERRTGVTSTEVRYELDRYLAGASASMKAWRAFGDGFFDDALRLYAQAIKEAKNKANLRVDRARLFYQMGRPDSALAELTAALEELRKRDKKDLIYVYDSKALIAHSIAMIHLRLDHTDAAKEALGQALQEDLSYYPAHLQLGFIALTAKDTAAALTEMELAAQVRADDAAVHYQYGFALASSGRHSDAEAQLKNALALDPVFASPHYVLGQVYERSKRTADAVAAYRAFLAASAKGDPRRSEVTERLTALGAAAGGTEE